MKAPAFDYVKPRSLDAVFALLAEYGDEARLLAGGQTLLATLNMRLSEPALLIDINGLAELRTLQLQGSVLRIGALLRHSEIETDPLIARHAPLLSQAVPHIAHRAIRNLGTFGGSIAHADPAAEWPCCLVALDGVVVLRSAAGERRVPAAEFFIDLYLTALRPGELIVACEIPIQQPGQLCAFDELARRHGDYAIAGLALSARQHPDSSEPGLSDWRLVFLGLGTTPIRAHRTEALLEGRALNAALIERAVESLRAELEPLPDPSNSAATKRHLATVLAQRLLRRTQAAAFALLETA